MPRMYGYKNVKWVTRIELQTTYDHIGFWEQRGYDKDAWVGRPTAGTSTDPRMIRRFGPTERRAALGARDGVPRPCSRPG